jgi:hypothetical protein
MGSHRWLGLAAVLGFVLVGVAAYNMGLAHGAAQAAAAAAAAGGTLPAFPYAYPFGWGWYRPWGFGFFFPLFFLFFWFVIARAIFWGGRWRRHGYDYRTGLEEWHRRAHERMLQDAQPPRA